MSQARSDQGWMPKLVLIFISTIANREPWVSRVIFIFS